MKYLKYSLIGASAMLGLWYTSNAVQKKSKPINPTSDTEILEARKRLVDQIYSSAPAEKTQTEAYLSIPMLKAAVRDRYPFLKEPKWQSFINKMIERERMYNATHYVFYHGFNKSWLVPGDLYLALYKRLRPLSANIKDFRFLRFEPAAWQAINTFMIQEMNAEGLIHDHKPNARASLLAVNLSLFGNTNNDGESTFHYFLRPTSHVTVGDWAWKMILDQFHAPEDPAIISKLNALDSTFLSPEITKGEKPSEQAILQIFIPKALVDKVAYLSYIEAIPRYQPLITWIENLAKDHPLKSIRYNSSKEITEAIRTLFKEHPNHPMKEQILKEIEGEKFRLSDLLEEYKKNPELIPDLNALQARILFTNDVLLHPSNDVLFFDYDFIPTEQKEAYKDALESIADEIAQQVLLKAATTSPGSLETQIALSQSQNPSSDAAENTEALTENGSQESIANLKALALKRYSPIRSERQQAIDALNKLNTLKTNES